MPQNWPSELPQQFDKDGYQDAFADNRLVSQSDLGPALIRSRVTAMPRRIAGVMKMSKKQLDRLHTFWVTDTLNGKLPFYFPDPVFGTGVRRNYIPNSGYDGAVPGNPGTGPNGWSGFGTQNGISVRVRSVGMEGDLEYVDVQFVGSPIAPSSAEVTFSPNIETVTGQVWTESLYARMILGNKTNISSILMALYSGPGAPGTAGFLKDIFNVLNTSELIHQRYFITATPTGNVSYVSPRFKVVGVEDMFMDITIRLAGIQLEKTDKPTEFISTPNTNTPITRFAAGGKPPIPVFLGGITWGVQIELELYDL